MNWLTLIVLPGLGIALLVLLARWLGFSSDPRLTGAAEARTVARDALVAFRADAVAVSTDARSALVAADDGRIALVLPHGDRWIVRVVNGARVTRYDDVLTLTLDEPMFAPVQVKLANDAAGWAARLEAAA